MCLVFIAQEHRFILVWFCSPTLQLCVHTMHAGSHVASDGQKQKGTAILGWWVPVHQVAGHLGHIHPPRLHYSTWSHDELRTIPNTKADHTIHCWDTWFFENASDPVAPTCGGHHLSYHSVQSARLRAVPAFDRLLGLLSTTAMMKPFSSCKNEGISELCWAWD